ncbi:MAG TPA: NUDIX domain-containing protein [bacterium]|nr:NUDIX domain-containing protein [bacterium]
MPAPVFCTQCAAALQWRRLEGERLPQPVCPRCGHVHWQNPKPTVAALIVRDGERGQEVLLVRRAVEPFRGAWDCPGGYIDPGESPEDALRRECREELGVEIHLEALVGIFPDRYGDDGEHTLNIYYRARIARGEPVPASDVAAAAWFPLDDPPEPIAFPNNRQALAALRA